MRRLLAVGAAAAAVAMIACRRAPVEWLVGQTHCHTDRSEDSATPPDRVPAWYGAHGFDFIVVTDHNVVTTMPDAPAHRLLIFPGAELSHKLDGVPLHVNALFVDSSRDLSIEREAPQTTRLGRL